MAYQYIRVPSDGQKITRGQHGALNVPDNPIIAFIEGDGTGSDTWKTAVKVIDSAVKIAYHGKKKISWMEIFAGEKSWNLYNKKDEGWLPQETLEAINEYLIVIKSPVAKPTGGKTQSIFKSIQQKLILNTRITPVRWFQGMPTPIAKPQNINMVIFRSNNLKVIEIESNSNQAEKIKELISIDETLSHKESTDLISFEINYTSKESAINVVKTAIQYAIDNNKDSVTIVHKGNNYTHTEGFFLKQGYETAKKQFSAKELDGVSWCTLKSPKSGMSITVKDVILSRFLQEIITRPAEYSVIATTSQNGDYISDILSALAGGTTVTPEAYINNETGTAIFKATHSIKSKYIGQDKINPSSVILSGEMMLRHIGWIDAANLIIKGYEKAILSKRVTYDLARLIDDATELKCSQFGQTVIDNI